MCGFGTWYPGQKYPDPWAGLAPISGGLGFVDYQMDSIKGIPLIASAGSEGTAMHADAG